MWRMFGSGHLPGLHRSNGYTGGMTVVRRLLLGCTFVLLPAVAAAQGVESVGMRALGMGGAFVAVADDASGTYWNPAGLVTGSVFSGLAEAGRSQVEDAPVGGAAGPLTGFGGRGSLLVALGTWPVGATFYRLSEATARVVGPATQAQNVVSTAALQRLTTTHVGVNVLHTIVSGLHVGATVKYVYGSAGQDRRSPAPGDPLAAAGDLDTRGNSRFDMDAGVMADLRVVKLGLAVRNLFEPEFDTVEETARLQLPRQVRAGVAFRTTETLIVSLDADLTENPDVTGDRRSLAMGAEQRLWQDRAAVRGGVRVSTLGSARPVLTTGGSVSLRSGIFADGYVAIGLDEASPDGFGVGIRMVF
jgi:hypothetical protein